MHSEADKYTNKLLFLALVLFTVSLGYMMKELLETDKLVNSFLLEKISTDQLNEISRRKKNLEWIGYAMSPALLFLKITIVSVVLWIGCFLFDKKANYRSIYGITLRAEFIFLFVIISKTVWFYFFSSNHTLEDVQYFYPLSVLSIVGHKELEVWYIYPLQILNLFEFIYWIVLIDLLSKHLKIRSEKVLEIVVSSYGVALIIWIAIVMFFSINFS